MLHLTFLLNNKCYHLLYRCIINIQYIFDYNQTNVDYQLCVLTLARFSNWLDAIINCSWYKLPVSNAPSSAVVHKEQCISENILR